MKFSLFLILLSFIISNPLTSLTKERKRKNMLIVKKIKECINEKASEAFKNIISDYEKKNITLEKTLRINQDFISREDLAIYRNCRKNIYLTYKNKFLKYNRP